MIDLFKLQTFSEEIVDMNISISITTSLIGSRDKGRILIVGSDAYIEINPEYVKSNDDLLEILAHELAHAQMRSKKHNKEFDRKKSEILKKLKNKLNRR